MADYKALKIRIDELAERVWDEAAIQARVRKMIEEGIPRKKLNPEEMLVNKEQILDRIQRRAEEYNYIFKNCAQGTALALMEEFGQGNMEIVKGLAAFPGIGGTGKICGGVTGSLVNIGLFFNSDNLLDKSGGKNTMTAAQKFMALFEERIGYHDCADIQEKVVLGRSLNPGESPAAMQAFIKEKGFEKCGLAPGIGVRIAAELMIDSIG